MKKLILPAPEGWEKVETVYYNNPVSDIRGCRETLLVLVTVDDDCDEQRAAEYIASLRLNPNGKEAYDPEFFGVCEECGGVYPLKDLHPTEAGVFICKTCAEHGTYVLCENCYTYVHRGDAVHVEDSDQNFCGRCADRLATQERIFLCGQCGRWYTLDQANWSERREEYLCDSCYEEEPDLEGVRDYHDNPELLFNSSEEDDVDSSRYYIGVELETESADDDVSTMERRTEIVAEYGEEENLLYQMHDGSLGPSGIEVISQPMTWRFLRRFRWEDLFRDLKDAGARAYDTEECGFHVHISRTFFRAAEEEKALARIRQFMADNKDAMCRVAGRDETRWAVYNDAKDGKGVILKKLPDDKGYHGERYKALNVTNSETIEFRIFKGCLNAVRFLASVEFCIRLCHFAHVYTEFEDMSWNYFMIYHPMSETLRDYLALKGFNVSEVEVKPADEIKY